jgi:hypothetical protein
MTPPNLHYNHPSPNNVAIVAPSLVLPPTQKEEHQRHHALSSSSPQGPFSYMGILLERDPFIQKSWGIVFVKNQNSHALIVGINPENHHQSMMTWCQSTRQIPHPSLVYHQHNNGSNNNDEYEQFLRQNFPAPAASSTIPNNNGNIIGTDSDTSTLFSSLCIQPGDAILSINGIPISSFTSTQLLANYIRQYCQKKMILFIMRHEFVWNATRMAMVAAEREQSETTTPAAAAGETRASATTSTAAATVVPPPQQNKESVSNTIRSSWLRVLNNYNHTNNSNSNVALLPTIRSLPSPPKKKRKKLVNQEDFLLDNRQLTNPMFKDEHGNPILYCDNDEFEPDDGKRIHMFLNKDIESDFNGWLKKRKVTWREKWMESIKASAAAGSSGNVEESTTVAHDFWLSNGYESFDQWLTASKTKWRRSYSWHVDRMNQLEEDCEKSVRLPYSPVLHNNVVMEQFQDWLNVRKIEWRIARRKRQRMQQTNVNAATVVGVSTLSGEPDAVDNNCVVERMSSIGTTTVESSLTVNNDTMYIDEILEKQQECDVENQQQQQQPMDISWIFDSQLGAPDDVVLVIMKYLRPFEHGNLLCLSFTSNHLFKQRDVMWKTLCPKHWVLPRRPRKSWCVLYITKIKAEEEEFRKRSDDLLVKANAIIEKGDLLQKLEKLVKKGEKDFRFDVNYTSGIVLERNSLLNMAIIDRRTKIAKWLMEVKGADIETWDRGQFTPLLNAAWNGDKHMVRYLLARGADRTKTGLNHSSKGLAPAGFKGLNAEQWARKRGHENVAELIRIGI